MSEIQSLNQQEKISRLKSILDLNKEKVISDVVLHEYPKWSVYFNDGWEWHSFDYDAFTQSALYKYLKENFIFD